MVLTLTQLGFLKTEEKSKINSVSQIDDETFRIILYKVINKIIQIKNLEVTFPEMPSREMNNLPKHRKVSKYLRALVTVVISE